MNDKINLGSTLLEIPTRLGLRNQVLLYDVTKLCWKCAAGELYALIAVSSKDITLLVMVNYGAFKTASFLVDTPFCLKQITFSVKFD